ncbi:MAG: long-chain-acyl-CoA synthetase [Steroidobacteraceae bacterium]
MTERSDNNPPFARAAWIRALERTASIERNPAVTLPVVIERLAQQFDAATALASAEGSISFRELGFRCNQYARWGLSIGIRRGDVVALLMFNCADYVCVWLGLTRIGATVALINTHLAGDALAQSINTAAPQFMIVGGALEAKVAAIRADLAAELAVWVHAASSRDFAALASVLGQFAGAWLPASECALPLLDSTALYIYTSGTSGLPKAARVSHYRVLQWSQWFAGMLDIGPTDRMYDCLPLYHSVGGVVAVGATLLGGGAVIIRSRFSAADFWRDVRDEQCTVFQYIGELCRYLVNAAPQPREAEHSLRIACGNGLRADIWHAFCTRFRIPRILEYYASTEGNFSLYNCEGEEGSIGRIPAFLGQRLQVSLVRFDAETGEPWRDAAGRCARCAVNEVGEAVGSIPGASDARIGRFEGYADREGSAGKVLHDVFESGDSWYRTGDLMRRDQRGFFYFVDRVGDTFRWKGENVSALEVSTLLLESRGVLECVVFGVSVPRTDGRAGMAALIVAADFDLVSFRAAVATRLPSYARPLFLRFPSTLAATGTYKVRTRDLAIDGFDPAKIADPLYFDDPRTGRYERLDAEGYAAIAAGKLRI